MKLRALYAGNLPVSGTAVLVAGTVTVTAPVGRRITATTPIQLTGNIDGGTPGWVRVSARNTVTGTFTITSSSGADTSTVAYTIHPF